MSLLNPKNLYYFLAYCWNVKPEYMASYSGEPFENHLNILAKLLIDSVNRSMKRGLPRDYITTVQKLLAPRGSINIARSITDRSLSQHLISCNVDEYMEDTKENRLIKITIEYMIRSPNIRPKLRRELKVIGNYLKNVTNDPSLNIKRCTIDYRLYPAEYLLALHVCQLFFEGMIPLEESGHVKVRKYISEDEEPKLFEGFVTNYYLLEHPDIFVNKHRISWNLPIGHSMGNLPQMEADIILDNHRGQTIIVDTKCYADPKTDNYGVKKYDSENLYQILAYVMNYAKSYPNTCVSGLLLYAKTTDEEFDETYEILGHRIRLKTLNLSKEWSDIRIQLDDIATTLSRC